MSVLSSSSTTLRKIVKLAASASMMAGAGMAAMGIGLIDVDPKMANVALVFTEPLGLPLQPFLVFVGVTKILSVLRLWDIIGGRGVSKKLAFIGLSAPATAAIYGHAKAEGSMEGSIPPFLYMCNLAFCYYLESKTNDEAKTKKK